MTLEGIVESGVGNAGYWLNRFAQVYKEWLGVPVFPGSLNLRTPSPIDWQAGYLSAQRRTFSLFPHGGERLIYMVPCEIIQPRRCSAFLWSTTGAAEEMRAVLEIIAPVCLRELLHLQDGSLVTLTCPRPWSMDSSSKNWPQTPPGPVPLDQI